MRIVIIVVVLLLVAAAGVAGWAWWIARSALPQVDGTIAVPGISAKVRVVRDEQGVPAIEAASLEDLFFAQGYVTAQDRLWQMDILRRAAAGELSEIIGESTLKMDREERILGLRVAAESAARNLAERERPYFDAYARGVNAFMESHRDRLPIEFRILKYQPRPWTITDSFLIGAHMVQYLNHYSYARALTRERVLAKLGPELTADLYVNSSWRDRPPTGVRRTMDQEPADANSEDDDDDDDVDTDGTGTTLTSGLGTSPSGVRRKTITTEHTEGHGGTSGQLGTSRSRVRRKTITTEHTEGHGESSGQLGTSPSGVRTKALTTEDTEGHGGSSGQLGTSPSRVRTKALTTEDTEGHGGTWEHTEGHGGTWGQLGTSPGRVRRKTITTEHTEGHGGTWEHTEGHGESWEHTEGHGGSSGLAQNWLAAALLPADMGSADFDEVRPGSNDWVVSGAHTTTGKPLLSNDMHLDHQMPNLWYEAHLKSGTYEVAGVTLPGVPFVIVGHNQRIGWGFTNVGPTVEDDYIEEFNAQGQYKVPVARDKGGARGSKGHSLEHALTEWREPEHRQEIIHVKGKPDVVLEVVTTRHGPIITELIPGETRQIALHWTLYDGMGLPFFDVDSAQNWEEFRKAFSNFAAPGQNVVYADIDGNIGYQATGRVPIRAGGDGSLPVSGSDDAHEWTGFIPFDEMPHIYNPPTGMVATANGRIAPDGYKYSISTEWDGPWRTDRIYRVLESGKKFAPADMLALEMDVSSTFDHFCADKFVYALDHAPKISAQAKKAADILRDWDGRMTVDSAAPTIEAKARLELVRLLLEPKLGKAEENPAAGAASGYPAAPNAGALSWKSYRWGMSSVWLENVLSKQPARWLPPGYSDYGAVLTAAMENTLKEAGVAQDLARWKWGENSSVEIRHPILSRLPLIGSFTGPGPHPQSGFHTTVKQVDKSFGPSERLTWNFADLDASTLNVVTGESGVFLSPNYMDQWPAWYGGTTFTLPFSDAAVEKHRAHALTLTPRLAFGP